MANFTLSVVAPDRSVVEEPVSSVVAPGQEGYFGVYAGHEPFAMALRAGLIEYMNANGRHYLTVSGGFAEIVGDKMTILADSAERVSEIDVARAERALEEARKALTGSGESDKTTDQAVAEMERAINRINAAKKS